MSAKEQKLTYADAGVDIDAGEALVDAIKPMTKATNRPGVVGGIGGFGGVFDLKAAGFDDPLLVSGTDGVGTKLRIAIDTGILDTVGIDLVAMCANDVLAQGAQPLFFLDYYATSKLTPAAAAQVVSGIAKGCELSDCALIGGETAEMPGMYEGDDFDLAGFIVGAVERDGLLPRMETMKAGDVLIGLASSGPHSNGYSLIRKIVERSGLGWQDPAPFNPGQSLGRALLEPTRIYVRPLMPIIKDGAIKGLAHITGGGLLDNIPRMLPANLSPDIDYDAWTLPPVFTWLQDGGNLSEREMRRTFNCGIGMVLCVDKDNAQSVIKALANQGESAIEIGTLIPSK